MKQNILLLLCCCALFPFGTQAQWLDFQDETAARLILTSVANSDDEEKDIETADLNNDGWPDVIVVRKEPFSISTEAAKSDLLLMNENGVLVDRTAQYAPEFISNITFARDLFIGDFDSDGWKDVVIANTFLQQPIYYKNLGNDLQGNWLGLVDESSTRFPVLTSDVPLICAVWAGDIDGDTDDDIYFVNYKQNANGGIAKDFLLISITVPGSSLRKALRAWVTCVTLPSGQLLRFMTWTMMVIMTSSKFLPFIQSLHGTTEGLSSCSIMAMEPLPIGRISARSLPTCSKRETSMPMVGLIFSWSMTDRIITSMLPVLFPM